MKKYLILLSVSIFLFTGCSKNEEENVTAVMKKNIASLQNEDTAGYMTTIDKESPVYGSTEAALQQLFGIYDISYDVEYYKVLSIEKDKAVIEIKVTSKKKSGEQPFQDNVSVQEHTMINRDGNWFITSTKLVDIKPI